MRYLLLIFVFIFLSAMFIGTSGFDENTTVEIATWQENSSGAATLSFDDGYLETYNAVIPVLAKRNISASFNVISAKVGANYGGLELADWSDWQRASENGHEIESHMATHVHIDEVTTDGLIAELVTSKAGIRKNTGGEAVSFVYPGGAYGTVSRDVVSNYFISARTSDDGYNQKAPVDMHLLKSKTVAEYNLPIMNEWADEASNNGLWLIENLHLVGAENPSGYSFYISTKDFESHVDYLESKDLWIASQGDVAKYIIERENSSATITVPSNFFSIIAVDLTFDLDQSNFDEPLTLMVQLPMNWTHVYATQKGERIDTRVSNGVLYVDVPPNNGKILITKHRYISNLLGLARFWKF